MRSGSLTSSRSALLASRAAQMRAQSTPSEERLWRAIRKCQLGVQFRRQVVIGEYIVDSLAPTRRLVTELDGDCHLRRRRADESRDNALRSAGFRVLRFEAELVMCNLNEAITRVRGSLGRSSLAPESAQMFGLQL